MLYAGAAILFRNYNFYLVSGLQLWKLRESKSSLLAEASTGYNLQFQVPLGVVLGTFTAEVMPLNTFQRRNKKR